MTAKRAMEKKTAEEILIDILSRLPVKSLLRFKCVCKRWRSLFSDPQFARTQLFRRSLKGESPSCSCPRRIFINDPGRRIDFGSGNKRGTAAAAFIVDIGGEFAYRVEPPFSVIAGSCNGLLCLNLVAGSDTFFVLNPATGESRELPKATCNIKSYRSSFFGFGYDSSTNDFKLVRGLWRTCGRSRGFFVEIFSFKENSWKRIECRGDGRGISNRGLFFNGSVHWLQLAGIDRSGYEYDSRVISLDLSNENFGAVVPLPDARRHLYFNGLSVHEGCLSATCTRDSFGAEVLEFWVMREYGVKSSWTRLYSLTPQGLPKSCYAVKVLYVWGDRKMLFNVAGHELVIYDTYEDKVATEICRVARGTVGIFDTDMFVESLISPNY